MRLIKNLIYLEAGLAVVTMQQLTSNLEQKDNLKQRHYKRSFFFINRHTHYWLIGNKGLRPVIVDQIQVQKLTLVFIFNQMPDLIYGRKSAA